MAEGRERGLMLFANAGLLKKIVRKLTFMPLLFMILHISHGQDLPLQWFHTSGSGAVIPSPNPGTIWAGGYYIPSATGKGGWGTISSWRSFFFFNHKNAVRQNGTVSQVRFYYETLAQSTFDSFYVQYWRRNGNLWDFVGQSENIFSKLTSGQVNIVSLDSGIAVHEGDYPGIAWNGVNSGGDIVLQIPGTQPTCAMYYYTDWSASQTDWYAKSTFAGYAMYFNTYENWSPNFVIVGNSIEAGYLKNESFLESDSVTAIDSSMGHMLADTLEMTYQNNAIGNTTTTQIQALFDSTVIKINPPFVVIGGGVNDVALGTPIATTVGNYVKMLDSCTAHGIVAVCFGILPWTNGTNAQMLTVDSINFKIDSICTAKGHYFVNCNSAVGVERTGGSPTPTPGNFWNIQTGLSPDGVHFYNHAYKLIATRLYNTIKPLTY